MLNFAECLEKSVTDERNVLEESDIRLLGDEQKNSEIGKIDRNAKTKNNVTDVENMLKKSVIKLLGDVQKNSEDENLKSKSSKNKKQNWKPKDKGIYEDPKIAASERKAIAIRDLNDAVTYLRDKEKQYPEIKNEAIDKEIKKVKAYINKLKHYIEEGNAEVECVPNRIIYK